MWPKLPEPRNSNCGIVFFLHLLAKEETMFAKTVTAALAGTALLATIASAQTPTTQTPTGTSDKATGTSIPEASLKGDWRASKVVGLKVYNDNNESLGSINDLLMDKGGNIKAVVLGVGGFLGMGEHLVAVPLDKVKFVNQPVAYSGTASNGGSAGGAGTGGGATTRPPTTTGSSSGTSSASTSKPNPWYPDHAVFNANKDELKAMPEFKYSTE
jgi:sporulation protein YlmC with PRC-barrel domain